MRDYRIILKTGDDINYTISKFGLLETYDHEQQRFFKFDCLDMLFNHFGLKETDIRQVK